VFLGGLDDWSVAYDGGGLDYSDAPLVGVSDDARKKYPTLPRPANAYELDTRTLPRPANSHELDTRTLPRPANSH